MSVAATGPLSIGTGTGTGTGILRVVAVNSGVSAGEWQPLIPIR